MSDEVKVVPFEKLVRDIAMRMDLPQTTVRELLLVFWDEVANHLGEGNTIRFPRGVGEMRVKVVPTKSYRVPISAGGAVRVSQPRAVVAERLWIMFCPSIALRDELRGKLLK